ncbi:hypothetical protein HMPREF3198_01108 [Winkia neuii]|nr:hypothetical protein HMPREF3198_01108 [Winkia neuii]
MGSFPSAGSAVSGLAVSAAAGLVAAGFEVAALVGGWSGCEAGLACATKAPGADREAPSNSEVALRESLLADNP